MMTNWAEQECRIACKRENPNFDFDSDDFDYGCSCYKSALKAYNSLLEDGHSGTSWEFTKNILIKLMNHQPLTPITDDDFMVEKHPEFPCADDVWLREQNLKSDIQCPRMSSLFRQESMGGTVTYLDVNRAYYIDIEEPSNTYSSNTKFLDEMFPITMPYYPSTEKYQIYAQTFLVDPKNGDFDTKGILYVITPDGKRVDLNIYKTEKDGKMVDISEDEYKELLKKRVDPVNKKVADHLLWTLVSNSADDKEIERREKAYKGLTAKEKNEITECLDEMCKFFDNPDHYQYNTFSTHQNLCRGENLTKYKNIPELIEISDYLKKVLNKLV